MVDREALISARQIDRKYATERELGWIDIWGANSTSISPFAPGLLPCSRLDCWGLDVDRTLNCSHFLPTCPYFLVLHKLCKRMGLRQQCTASAIVFFRRFYLKNSYCETEPCVSGIILIPWQFVPNLTLLSSDCGRCLLLCSSKGRRDANTCEDCCCGGSRRLCWYAPALTPLSSVLETYYVPFTQRSATRPSPPTPPSSARWSSTSSKTSNATSSCSILIEVWSRSRGGIYPEARR